MDDVRQVHVYDYTRREQLYEFKLKVNPTCVSISRDSTFLLINKRDDEIQLLNLETRQVVHKYKGNTGGSFTIRSAFGGAGENFVISGSEGKSSVDAVGGA